MSRSIAHAGLLVLATVGTAALWGLSADRSGSDYAAVQRVVGDLYARASRIDHAVIRLTLGSWAAYDNLTQTQHELARWARDPQNAAAVEAIDDGDRLAERWRTLRSLIEKKLFVCEDFKAIHSVGRNAMAGFFRNAEAAVHAAPPGSPQRDALERLEVCGLRCYYAGSRQSDEAFLAAIQHAETAADNGSVDTRSAANAIRCGRKLLGLRERLERTLDRLVATPIQAAGDELMAEAARTIRANAAEAVAYRAALLAAIAVLVAYCVYLCVVVARHARALHEANGGLEQRVRERTQALTQKTEALEASLRARDALEDALSEARKLEAIGQLAAGVAHEINTPLQFVGSNIEFLDRSAEGLLAVVAQYETLLRDSRTGALTERIEAIEQSLEAMRFEHVRDQLPQAIADGKEGVRRVVEIVRAMRQLSHPGSKHKAATDINEALRSAATITRNRWKQSATLELDLCDELPRVDAYLAELNQVFLNLIVNAADAIAEQHGEDEPRGVIRIITRPASAGVMIAVEDNGCGMPDDVRRRIFEPFFTTKEVGKGTGQGLAITHQVIVGRHGGSIDVSTASGEGTRFELTLPLRDPQSEEDAADLTTPAATA